MGEFVDDVHVNVGGHQDKCGPRVYNTKLRFVLLWIQQGRVSERKASCFYTPEHGGVQLCRGHPDVSKSLFTTYDLRGIEASKRAVRILVRRKILKLVRVPVVRVAKAYDAVLDQSSYFQFLQKRVPVVVLGGDPENAVAGFHAFGLHNGHEPDIFDTIFLIKYFLAQITNSEIMR